MSITTQKTMTLEVDQKRQEALAEMLAEHGPNYGEQFAPGSFGCHELLDRALLAAEFVEETVLSHPACVQNAAWYALAEKAVAALNDLYQQVGAAHLAEKNDVESNGEIGRAHV